MCERWNTDDALKDRKKLRWFNITQLSEAEIDQYSSGIAPTSTRSPCSRAFLHYSYVRGLKPGTTPLFSKSLILYKSPLLLFGPSKLCHPLAVSNSGPQNFNGELTLYIDYIVI